MTAGLLLGSTPPLLDAGRAALELYVETAITVAYIVGCVVALALVQRRLRLDLGSPARAIRRGLIRSRWASVARSCGLAVTKDRGRASVGAALAAGVDNLMVHGFGGQPSKGPSAKPETVERLPKLRHGHASPDRLTVTWRVKPARGQTVEDIADQAQALADGLGVEKVVVRRIPGNQGELVAYLADPFGGPRAWEPVVLDHPAIPWGHDEQGQQTVFRLGLGHALVAGSIGSGKSAVVNAVVGSASLRSDVAILGVDIKGGVELGPWRDRLTDLAVDPKSAAALIAEVADLVRWRYTEMSRLGVRKMTSADQGIGPWVLLVIDELSELLDAIDKGNLVSIARLARACGVALFVATQRPSATTLSMDLRDQLDVMRWCGRVPPNSTTGGMVLGDGCPLDPSTIDKTARGVGVLDDAEGVRFARADWLDDERITQVVADTAHLRIPRDVLFGGALKVQRRSS